jgi:hypothetical protein
VVSFVLDGREYPWPDLDTITLEDSILLKTCLGQHAPSVTQMITDLSEGTADEFTLFSLFIIAKHRADGGVDPEAIKKIPLNALDLIDEGDDEEAEEESPLVEAESEGEPEAAPSSKPKSAGKNVRK